MPARKRPFRSHSSRIPSQDPRGILCTIFNTPKKGFQFSAADLVARTQHVHLGTLDGNPNTTAVAAVKIFGVRRQFDTCRRCCRNLRSTPRRRLSWMCATLRQSRSKSTSATRTRDQPNWPRVHHYCLGQDRGLDMGVKPMPSAGAASLSSRSSAAITTGLRSGCATKPSR